MGTLMLLCTALLGHGGTLTADACRLTPEAQSAWHVEVTLVDVLPSGERQVMTTPVITLQSGQCVRAECSADSVATADASGWRVIREECEHCEGHVLASNVEMDRSTAWRMRVAGLDNGNVRLDLSLRRPEVERAVSRGVLTESRHYNLVQQVQPSGVHKVVLACDDSGRAVSWLEVRVRASGALAGSVDEGEPQDADAIRPFWYEPF